MRERMRNTAASTFIDEWGRDSFDAKKIIDNYDPSMWILEDKIIEQLEQAKLSLECINLDQLNTAVDIDAKCWEAIEHYKNAAILAIGHFNQHEFVACLGIAKACEQAMDKSLNNKATTYFVLAKSKFPEKFSEAAQSDPTLLQKIPAPNLSVSPPALPERKKETSFCSMKKY